jgi:hypothetical protein
MHDEYYRPDHYTDPAVPESPYDQMRRWQKLQEENVSLPSPDYVRIDNPLSVYLFEDKAVIIHENGQVTEYSRA